MGKALKAQLAACIWSFTPLSLATLVSATSAASRASDTRSYLYSLHCSSFLGLPFDFGILNIDLVKPKKGTTMETIGRRAPLLSIAPYTRAPPHNPLEGLYRAWGLQP